MAKSAIVKGVLKKAVNPRHAYAAYKRQRSKGDFVRASDDPQLKLIAKICPGDFLNYGYFENTDLQGVDVCVSEILRAQTRNAELLIELICEDEKEILDVGCGLGGVLGLLRERGLDPVGLSPNKYQLERLKKKFANIELIESKFEEMPLDGNGHRFDAVLMSESFQYMNLDRVCPTVDKILKPGGRWLMVDFFRTDEIGEKSGHFWDAFEQRLHAAGFRVVHELDHTANVMPLLRYIHMLANDVFRPMADYAVEKLKEKQPGFHYLLEEAIEKMNAKGDKLLDVIDPESFAAHKKYVLLTIERS